MKRQVEWVLGVEEVALVAIVESYFNFQNLENEKKDKLDENIVDRMDITDRVDRVDGVDRVDLDRIDVTLATHFTNTAVSVLSKHLSRIRVLNLGGLVSLSEETLEEVSKCEGMGKLERVCLRDCILLSDFSISSLLYCSGGGIREMDLGGVSFITDKTVESISLHCKKLVSLSLSSCLLLSDTSLSFLSLECRELECLNVAGVLKLSDSPFQTLSKHSKKLRRLDFSHCNNITDAALEELAKECRNLESLKMNSCVKIKGEALPKLLEENKGIVELECSRMRMRGEYLEEASKVGRELERLSLDGADLSPLSFLLFLSHSFHSLSHLSIKGCGRIGEEELKEIRKCSKLKSLCVDGLYRDSSHQVTPLPILLIASHCKELERIELDDCRRVSEACLVELVKKCTRLTSINLASSSYLTHKFIKSLANHCPLLKHLNISKCVHVGVSAISRFSLSLFLSPPFLFQRLFLKKKGWVKIVQT